jgi:hypothetical protein
MGFSFPIFHQVVEKLGVGAKKSDVHEALSESFLHLEIVVVEGFI